MEDGEDKTLHAVSELRTQMERRMNGMREEMHAQNQLLLSKISALSSQNSNAPGIFDGADRRKLEQEQERLRQSGQEVPPAVRQRQLAFFDMAYPMWLIPVSTLLQCEHLPSHQEALAMGMLVQYTHEIAGRVIFVSHEWLSLGHADPDGEQLRELQRLLIRMMKGEVNAEHRVVKSTQGWKGTESVTREEWAASLPFSFVWLDFLSIPQPCMEEEESAVTAQDHRHGMSAASKSAHQLALAVNSIPAYARASSLMLLLTPFIRHKDRGNICSFQSWRKRGWCRLEVTAAKLATHDLRVITVNGGEAVPMFLRLNDVLALQVGQGNYTCCSCDHDFGTGVKVRCDKAKVWPVLARMVNDAARFYKQQGELYMTRYVLTHQFMFEGLPRPVDADFSLSFENFGSLSEWKQRLFIGERGEDWEATFEKETGFTLLHALAMASALPAIQELVNQPNFQAASILSGSKPVPKFGISPSVPLVSALLISPSFDTAGVFLQKLDEAGLRENIPPSAAEVLGYLQRAENTRKWLQLFPVLPQMVPRYFTTFCRFADVASMKALVDSGANVDEAEDVLHTVSQNYDFGQELTGYLLSIASPGLINKVKQTAPPQALVAGTAAAKPGREQARSSWLGRLLPKKAHVMPVSRLSAAVKTANETGGDSPLHTAIKRANIGVMIELLKHQSNGVNADLSLRNAVGQTASELVKQQYNSTTPPVLSELLRSAAYYNANAVTSGRRNNQGGGRSAEITRTEMEDTIRTMADAMKAKDEAMREKDEVMRAKDEAMRAKDDAMLAKDKELNNTIKTLTESMRAMEREMSAMRSAPTLTAAGTGSAVAGPRPSPAIADIVL